MTRLAMLLLAALGVAAPAVADNGWQPIFDGRGLTGWEQVGPGKFVLEDGLLKTQGGMGMLWFTPRKIGNATIRIVYRTANKAANSGVFIRIPEKPTEPWMPVNRGYEVQIDDSENDNHVTGVLYSLTKAMARPGKPGDWNEMEITLDGPRTVVVVNGAKVTDYTEGQPVPPKVETWEPDRGPRAMEGYIGLQNHSDKDVVWFKEVSIKPLPLASGPHSASGPDVQKLDAERFAAMVKGDVAALDGLLADDLVYTHASGKVDSKASFLDDIKAGLLRYKVIRPEEPKLRVYGDTAVATGLAAVEVNNHGQELNMKLRYTDVWVNRGGKWQMVAWQATRLPAP
jgi:ketosteroid isomerase-like protein